MKKLHRVRIPPESPVKFFHRYSESTEHTVLHTSVYRTKLKSIAASCDVVVCEFYRRVCGVVASCVRFIPSCVRVLPSCSRSCSVVCAIYTVVCASFTVVCASFTVCVCELYRRVCGVVASCV